MNILIVASRTRFGETSKAIPGTNLTFISSDADASSLNGKTFDKVVYLDIERRDLGIALRRAIAIATMAKDLDIGEAVAALRAGKRVGRAGWNGKGMYLELQVPDAHSKMSLPYVFMFTACANQVPWLASQTDLLATDWQVVA